MTRYVLVFPVLLVLAATGYAQPKTYEMKVADFADSLVAVDGGLPLVDSADDRPTFTLDGQMMIFGSERFSPDKWRSPSTMRGRKWDSDIWYRVLTDSGWSIPINLGEGVNDAGSQMNPTIHPRGDIVYFVRTSAGELIWQARLEKGKFVDPKPVKGMINKLYADKSTAAFVYQNNTRNAVLKEMNADSNLLDLRKRAPDAWQVHYTERINRRVNTWGKVEFWEGYLRCENAVFPDGHAVIFSENFGQDSTENQPKYGLGGKGWGDLWFCNITPEGEWDSVRYLKGNINTEYNEIYPFIAADGVTLYFSSNRPCPTCPEGTSGMEDIYVSRLSDSGWSDPVPLGPPFNSPRSDYGFSIGPDGETAYFVSNRNGPSNVFQVKLRPQDSLIKPRQVFVVQGRVTDFITGKPVKAEIFVDNLGEERTKFSVTSDSISGNYALALQRGSRYGLQAVADGYLPKSERFQVPRVGAFDRTKLDIQLAPIKVGSTAEFKNVLFEFGKATLLKESQLELDRVAEFLRQGARKIKIEIQGHTDDVGTDAYNNRLSAQRAKSVMQYLASKGVKRSTMVAKGYGKSKPLATGTTDADRAKNRRVEMLIIESD